jgi:hypothetical protein
MMYIESCDYQPTLLPRKANLHIEGEIKTFHEEQKL